MTNETNFAGTRISGAHLAVLTMAHAWKPRMAPFGQRTVDNYTGMSARRYRPT